MNECPQGFFCTCTFAPPNVGGPALETVIWRTTKHNKSNNTIANALLAVAAMSVKTPDTKPTNKTDAKTASTIMATKAAATTKPDDAKATAAAATAMNAAAATKTGVPTALAVAAAKHAAATKTAVAKTASAAAAPSTAAANTNTKRDNTAQAVAAANTAATCTATTAPCAAAKNKATTVQNSTKKASSLRSADSFLGEGLLIVRLPKPEPAQAASCLGGKSECGFSKLPVHHTKTVCSTNKSFRRLQNTQSFKPSLSIQADCSVAAAPTENTAATTKPKTKNKLTASSPDQKCPTLLDVYGLGFRD